MPTKPIKSGLSKANVNAIAGAIGTATLNRLVPQFSTSVAYEKGQYTNYNNQLYRFTADKSAGAWDSTKVESASLNDLINDVNDAVESVNNKANVDGNYPTMTVGLADNLTPYGEDSGAEQEQPFISQGTGCGNGTEIVTTGDYALLREKQGHTLVANQLYNASVSIISSANPAVTLSNTTFIINGTANESKQYTQNYIDLIAGHKYLVIADVKNYSSDNIDMAVQLWGQNVVSTGIMAADLNKNGINFFIATPTGSGEARLRTRAESGSTWNNCTMSLYVIDITQMFNGDSDIIADLTSHPENFFRYCNGSLAYNAGSLESSNGVKLVSTGRNLFDKSKVVEGKYMISTGEQTNSSYAHSDYIIAIPNIEYYVKNITIANYIQLFVCYDKYKNYIGYGQLVSGSGYHIYKTLPNTAYVIINIMKTEVEDETLSLYYTPEQGGEGYDQYYPHEEPTIVDTGSETLLSAGNAHDYKTSDGTIHRLVGVVDLGTLDWTYLQDGGTHYFQVENGVIQNLSSRINKVAQNILCQKYDVCPDNQLYVSEITGDKVINHIGTRVVVVDSSYTDAATFKSAMSGVYLFYELATETTEQGTTFPENIKINDYGMMYWLDSSNNLVSIPQGNKLFYPVNYKGFVDDVYSRTSGDSSNIVIQSELSASETARDTVDTQLQNAIGGTLRQCLCVKESLDFDNTNVVDLGTLTYVADHTSHRFYLNGTIADAVAPNTNTSNAKIICTKYKTTDNTSLIGGTVGIAMNTSKVISISDSGFENATATEFATAMKGVLLAYEKE